MHNLNEIKTKLSCVDYLSMNGIDVESGKRTVSPLRAGATNSTSFYVSDDFWYDFGSGSGGDVIDLAAQLNHKGDVGSAIRELATLLGIQSDNPRWKQDIQNLCNRTAAYHAALTDSDRDYLYKRGLSDADIDRLMIGRVTDGYLKGRLFLPYFKNGAVMYYATRAMPDGADEHVKYKKASRKECDSYQNIPWGLQTLNRGNDTLIISEGYFDAVSWEIEGYSVISPITGSFSSEQMPTVISACKTFKRVVIIFDNDTVSHAGEGFTRKTAQFLYRNRIPFSVAYTPPNIKDVNDYYSAGGDLQALINNAIDGHKFLAQQFVKIEDFKKFLDEVKRSLTETELATLISSMQDRFSQMELKALYNEAKKPPSEKDIAEELINQYQIIYIDKVGFYMWNGKIWEKTSDLLVEHYADKAYGLFSTAKRIKGATAMVKAKSLTETVFDRKPVLTFQNGVLEIETGRFREFLPNDYCSIIMNYSYDPSARCDFWEKFINDITNDDPYRIDLLQTIAGYILFPDCRHQKVFILVGSGGNGKSVYLEIIQKLFGDKNTTHVEPTGLTKEFERIHLKDSLLNIGSDINSDFSKGEIREWLLKVADGTSIQACYKGMNHVDFIPRCKLLYACNSIPNAEVVNGLSRRLKFIEFPCQFVDNPDPNNPYEKLKDINTLTKLMENLPAIFNWAYEGYKTLTTVGYFTDTLEQETLIKQFETISNPVAVFCDDTDFEGEISRDNVYLWYKDWCDETNHKPLSREKFLPKFREAMGSRILEEKDTKRGGKRARLFVFAD